MLTVLKLVEPRRTCTEWECLCECGNTVKVRQNLLTNRQSRACRCVSKFPKHMRGYIREPEYKSLRESWVVPSKSLLGCYHNMIKRCHDPSNKAYADYGGRGITVCEEWRNDSQAFYKYIGERPGPEYSLDRKDNSGNYEPGNVKWSTDNEQARNKRSTKLNEKLVLEMREAYRNGKSIKEIHSTMASHASLITVEQAIHGVWWKDLE